MESLTRELSSRTYPGRVCAIIHPIDGRPHLAYALTGRSEASRSRALAVEADRVMVVDTRPSGTPDELRHYVAALRTADWTVIGNGDHVEPLAATLQLADAATSAQLENAWRPHTFEPDPPIHTPRIWVAARTSRPGEPALWAGSVVRAADGSPEHRVWRIEGLQPGQAVLLTTYGGGVDEPEASGRAVRVMTDADRETIPDTLWGALDPGLRVASMMVAVEQGDFGEAALRS